MTVVAAILVAILVLRLALQGTLWVDGFESFTADEFARVVVAARWAETGSAVSHGPWPPLQFYVVGAALRAHWDLVVTPRVVATVAGLVAILLVYAIGTRLAGRAAGVLAALALAVHPSHVWLSSTPLSEGLYGAAWLAAVAAALRFVATGRLGWLLAAAAACGAASAIRLEGWIVAGLFVTFVAAHAWRHRRAASAADVAAHAAAALVAVAFPLAWLASNAIADGTAVGFVADIERYKRSFAALHHGFAAGPATWLRVLAALDPLVAPAAVAGAVVLGRRRSDAFAVYALLGCAPLAVFLAGHFGHVEPWRNHVRYLSPFLWMLLPLAASGAIAAWEAARRALPGRVRATAAAASTLAVVWQMHRALGVENDPAATGVDVGRELARLRGTAASDALLEVDYFEYLAVHVGAHDVRRIVYDRALDAERVSALREAVGGAWPAAWHGACGGLPTAALDGRWLERCLRARGVAHVVARTPAVRARLERELRLVPAGERNGYGIYAVPPELRGAEVAAR